MVQEGEQQAAKQRAGLEHLSLHTGEEDTVQREEALTGRGEGGGGRGEGGGVCVCVWRVLSSSSRDALSSVHSSSQAAVLSK